MSEDPDACRRRVPARRGAPESTGASTDPDGRCLRSGRGARPLRPERPAIPAAVQGRAPAARTAAFRTSRRVAFGARARLGECLRGRRRGRRRITALERATAGPRPPVRPRGSPRLPPPRPRLRARSCARASRPRSAGAPPRRLDLLGQVASASQTGIFCPRYFSIGSSMSAVASSTRLIALPPAPARAVRPMRWT